MADFNTRLINRLQTIFRSILWRDPQQADTGRLDSSGNPSGQPTDGLEPGEIWVRLAGSRAETVALNGIIDNQKSNIPVIVGVSRFSKKLEIIALDLERARLRFGDAISSLYAQPSGDLSRTTTTGRNFKPGRVRVDSGLTLIAHDFFYKDTADAIKLWRESDGSVTVTAPAASGGTDTERWTIIALDPDATTPALVAIDGTAQLTTLPSPLQPEDIADIAITDGYIPLAAVRLTTGDTSPTEEQFVDFRLYFEKDGAVSGMTSFTVAGDSGSSQTISNGNTLTIAGGTNIASVASATDTITLNLDSAPTISDFTNMAHDHLDADDGGTLSASAIASGTLAHERGGLEADVSAYDGLIRIASGATTNIKSNFAASAAPGVGDDSGDGYSIGSLWLDTTADRVYQALDVSVGAANWQLLGGKAISAIVYDSNGQTISDNTVTAIAFDSERLDTDSIHSLAMATSRLTAPVAGVYFMFGNVTFASNATGDRLLRITLNGLTPLTTTRISAAAVGARSLNVGRIYVLAATDYIELEVLQTSGGNLDVNAAGDTSPEFGLIWLGKTA